MSDPGTQTPTAVTDSPRPSDLMKQVRGKSRPKMSKRKRLFRHLRKGVLNSWLFCALVRASVWIVAHLPLRFARKMGAGIGGLFYHLQRTRRPLSLDNLASAFPEKTPEQRVAILKACYRHLGICGAEFCRFTRFTKDHLLGKVIFPDDDAFEVTRAAFAEGKGVIAVASHIGNWELCGFASRVVQFDVVSVSRAIPVPRLESYLRSIRERLGNQMVNQDGALRAIVRALKENRCAGILTDLHAGREYPWIPFFGKPASTFDTCARLHLKTGAPLVRVLMVRRPDGNYRWNVKRIELPALTGSEEQKIAEILTRMNRSLEEGIREYPEQWVWMNKRWRKQP